MEELRSYFQIPNNIDIELSDGLAESTISKEDGAVFYQRTACSRASLPRFVSNQAVPTLLRSAACSYPSECHSDLGRM